MQLVPSLEYRFPVSPVLAIGFSVGGVLQLAGLPVGAVGWTTTGGNGSDDC